MSNNTKDMKPIGYIYLTTCLANGKIYVGKHEFNGQKNYIGSGTIFKLAVKKCGKENFKRKILRLCYSLHELRVWEHVYIVKYKSYIRSIGYNIAKGDVNSSEYNPAKLPEVREKLLIKNRQTTRDPEYRRRHSEIMKEYYKTHPATFTGKHHTEETKEKIRQRRLGSVAYNKGVPASEEQKKKQSEKMKGRYVGEKNTNYGHRWTEEQRKHLSEVKRGLAQPNKK